MKIQLPIPSRSVLAVLWLLASVLCVPVCAQPYSIDWYRISGGGGTSTGAVYSVSGTIGQDDAGGSMSSASYWLTGGFWALISVVQTPGLPELNIWALAPNRLIVAWPNTGNYTLQRNSSLTSGGWTTSGNSVTTANGTNSVTITPSTGTLFFRLKL